MVIGPYWGRGGIQTQRPPFLFVHWYKCTHTGTKGKGSAEGGLLHSNEQLAWEGGGGKEDACVPPTQTPNPPDHTP